MKRALITGIGGQDGSLLVELLLGEGYEVAGIARCRFTSYENLDGLLGRIQFLNADLLKSDSLAQALADFKPQEVYNFASPSFVPRSWEDPITTAEFAAIGVTALLEAIRTVDGGIRLYQASSSEIFGWAPTETPQTEETPLRPLTPYGVAKAYGHFIVQSYRRRYGFFACCGILYNHTSPRQSLDFLPRKVARAAAAISLGLEEKLLLGDLNARRDWGYAPDYVRAIWLMLQQSEPDDYVIASGESHSVGELAECAFVRVGLDWKKYVRSETTLFRGLSELHHLIGDASRARKILGWESTVGFEDLVGLLVDAEVKALSVSAAVVNR
jgi:GDPmannose 4,6-dehydratase